MPRWLLIPAAAAIAVVAVPLAGMLLQVPWGDFVELVTAPSSLDALWLSMRTCLVSTAVCVVLGAPLAIVLGRSTGRAVRPVRTLVTLPLVLPPVVAGIALLATFGRAGLFGGHLEAAGLRIAFTTLAVVMAQVFVALPFLVISLEGAVRTAGHAYEDIAATLGARPTTVLRRVTLPLLAPALASGTALSFARCLGEFGATLAFAGSLQGVTRTMPLEIYLQREVTPEAALALSVVLVAVAAVVVLATGGRGARPGGGRDGAVADAEPRKADPRNADPVGATR